MSDVTCPYCGEEQEINHDDGYGYEEDEAHEQDCLCGKTFRFNTRISYNYTVECQEDDHDMEPFGDKWPGMYQCKNCDHYELRKDEPETKNDNQNQ